MGNCVDGGVEDGEAGDVPGPGAGVTPVRRGCDAVLPDDQSHVFGLDGLDVLLMAGERALTTADSAVGMPPEHGVALAAQLVGEGPLGQEVDALAPDRQVGDDDVLRPGGPDPIEGEVVELGPCRGVAAGVGLVVGVEPDAVVAGPSLAVPLSCQ